jgi:hypothetical protein
VTTSKKQRKMVALKVLETSGVDHPAHLEEGWIVMKNAGTATEAQVSDTNENTENTEVMDSTLEEAYIERVIELEKALAASEAKVAEMTEAAEKAKVSTKTDKMDDEDEDEDEEMMDEEETYKSLLKSVPAPVREMLEKAENAASAAREELRKEREARADELYVAKAAGWSHLTLDSKEVGPALRRLHDIDGKLADSVEKALEAANAQSESAAIFEEIGRGSRPSDGSAYSKVETLAKAAYDAGEFPTLEQAISATVLKNPDLYAAYRNER